MRILIVEDDAPLGEFLKLRLREHQFSVDIAAVVADAIHMTDKGSYDLVLLDLGLPGADGMELLRHIRGTKPQLLVLLLMGSATSEDRVKALDAGADDYMTKPFSFAELSARIRALLRRIHAPASAVLKVEDLELDRIGRTVRRGGCAIDLTQKEFALLELLMQRPLQPMSRVAITEQAWKSSDDTTTNIVDVYINYLRKKIDSGFDRPLIRTIRGVGYQIGGAAFSTRSYSAPPREPANSH
jgi:DNA-binding response OmpR family regulator